MEGMDGGMKVGGRPGLQGHLAKCCALTKGKFTSSTAWMAYASFEDDTIELAGYIWSTKIDKYLVGLIASKCVAAPTPDPDCPTGTKLHLMPHYYYIRSHLRGKKYRPCPLRGHGKTPPASSSGGGSIGGSG
jgi:hypothetical protein